MEAKKADDPIARWAAHLLEQGLAEKADLEKLDEAADQAVLDAVEFARNSPFPEPEELYTNVYV